MSTVQIRPARPQDADALAAVIRAAYAPWAARLPDLPDVAGGMDRDIDDHMVWVATDGPDGPVVGGVVLVMTRDRARIANLAVDPQAGGRGVATRLLDTAASRTRAMGQWTLYLTTHREMAPTIRFYLRNGWRETGRDGIRVFMEKCLV